MKEPFDRLRGSVTGKIAFIGLLSLVLLVPIQMIENLIAERAERMEAARSEIAGRWGSAQTVGAPMLVVPIRDTATEGRDEGGVRPTRDVAVALPASLTVEGRIAPRTLRRGIYEVPVYEAAIEMRGVLRPPALDGRLENAEMRWDEAQIVLPLSDARALAEPVRLRIADAEGELQAGSDAPCVGMAAVATPTVLRYPQAVARPEDLDAARRRALPDGVGGLAQPVAVAAAPARPQCGPPGDRLVVRVAALGLEPLTAMQSFALELTVRGTERLHFLPFGDVTDVTLRSAWPSPSFDGAFLPAERKVTDEGFVASWRVPAFGRGYPSSWLRSTGFDSALVEPSFGVSLMTGLGVHETTLRASKHAVLFIGLTFAVYFLFELFASLRLHALHYLLVGAANCMFFVLLLALGEHVGFPLAYLASAAASAALITSYSASILAAGRRALAVGAVLAAIYSYLYVTLNAEDYALLLGALALFTVLAAFMMLTRHVDWHAARFAGERAEGSPSG